MYVRGNLMYMGYMGILNNNCWTFGREEFSNRGSLGDTHLQNGVPWEIYISIK